MADNFTQMGATPDFYGSILNSARQKLVRMPDGTYRAAPQISAPTSLSNIYGGMYAPAGQSGSAALTSHPVKLVAIDGAGQPKISASAKLTPSPGSMKTEGQAGNVALPPGVVPQQAKLDMAALAAMTPGPILPPASHHAIATQERLGTTPSPVLSFAGDENTGLRAPGVAAIKAATNPFAGASGGITGGLNYPITPPIRDVSIGKQPLTKFLPASQRQNDTLTTLGNNVGNVLSATPAGHIYSLLTGGSNNGGGLLNTLFGYGGLLNSGKPANANVAPPPTVLSPTVHAALLAQQSSDQRGIEALRAAGLGEGQGGSSGGAWGVGHL